MPNRLTLFGTNSGYAPPFNDVVKGGVLSTNELDNNLIHVKGLAPKDVTFDGSNLNVNRINGGSIGINIVDIIQSVTSGSTGGGPAITGGTYDDSTGELLLTDSSGGTITIVGFFKSSDDIYTTGITFNQSNYQLSTVDNSGSTFTTDLSILASDLNVTGGTYDPNTGIATFTNNSGGTFNVSGFLVGMTDIFVTGGTYDNNTGTVSFVNTSGGTFDVSGFLTGVTTQYVNYIIPSGETITVSLNEQYIVYGDLLLEGQLDNFGQVVIIDGNLVNSGGTFNNSGELILVDTNIQFTGNTSGSCINELFVNTIRGCDDNVGIFLGEYSNPIGVDTTGSTIFYSGGTTSASFAIGDTQQFGFISGWSLLDSNANVLNSVVSSTGDTRMYYSEINTDVEIELILNNTGIIFDIEGSGKTVSIENRAVGEVFMEVKNDGHITCPSTGGTFTPPKITESVRDSITPVSGMVIYNTDTDRHQGYENNQWVNFRQSQSYGSISSMTGLNNITINTQGVYEVVTGFTGTAGLCSNDIISSPSGFGIRYLGLSGKTFEIYASYDGKDGNNSSIGLKLWGSDVGFIDESECRSFAASASDESKTVTRWIIQPNQNEDMLISVANHTNTTNIDIARARMVLTEILT
jgi:hypothetical protein